MTFSQKIEFSIIQVLIQASNLKITAEGPDGAPLHAMYENYVLESKY